MKFIAASALVTLIMVGAGAGTRAGSDILLTRIKGGVTFVAAGGGSAITAPPSYVVSYRVVSEGDLVGTERLGGAVLDFPDSSSAELQGLTRVRVGAFSPETHGATLFLYGGSLTLHVSAKDPRVEYRIRTVTFEIVTHGNMSVSTSEDKSRVDCQDGDLTVITAATSDAEKKTYTLTPGQSFVQTLKPTQDGYNIRIEPASR